MTKLVLIPNSCFIQYNTPFEKHVENSQQVYSFRPESLVLSQFQMNFTIFQVKLVSITIHENI